MVRYIHTVILALLLPFAAVGQGKTFNVEGHIMSSGFDFEEPEGEPFIKVSLKDSSLKVIDSDETGFDGKYRFENIPEGTYRLCFKALGYYDFDTVINIGSDVRIDTLFHDDLSTQPTESYTTYIGTRAECTTTRPTFTYSHTSNYAKPSTPSFETKTLLSLPTSTR